MPCRIYGNACDRHEYYGRKCNGYTVKHLTSVAVKRGYESILCLCVYYESNITERNCSDRSRSDRFELFKAMCRKSDYDKRKHKRVAVGKPVGHLSAVPYHIDRTDIHTYNKQAYKRTCRNFLLEFKCSRAEKSRRKHKGKRTAEQRRQTLHPYRIVGIGEQLSCYIYKVKIINKRIIRLGEAEFAVLK